MLLTGAAIFVMALFWSAVLDPAIRLLHALQTLIYVAVVVLARRNSPWGSPRPPREPPPLRGVGPRFHLRRVRFLGIRCRHTLRPQMDLCGCRRRVRRGRLLRCHRRQRRARHRLTPAQFATHQSRCRGALPPPRSCRAAPWPADSARQSSEGRPPASLHAPPRPAAARSAARPGAIRPPGPPGHTESGRKR